MSAVEMNHDKALYKSTDTLGGVDDHAVPGMAEAVTVLRTLHLPRC